MLHFGVLEMHMISMFEFQSLKQKQDWWCNIVVAVAPARISRFPSASEHSLIRNPCCIGTQLKLSWRPIQGKSVRV